ncbi:MAG: protein kinase [Gemmataceae bacterium]|nr:protein kinase [Gemmataceae bacterium]
MNEETLFELAVNTPPTERAALLDRECAGNPGLRARIEALLAADAASHSPLDSPPQRTDDPTHSFGPKPEHDLAATGSFRPTSSPETEGTIIAGRYKLRQQIGEGGMGTVWMADQTEPVKRKVAVKLIRVERGQSKTILARFEAERQAIALMDHPHIAKLLDAGTTETGSPFFVMELVKGIPLSDFCDQHKLTIAERLNLFTQICSAVQHAHQKGIIHRDLKPGNILVESHDGKPVPKVIDFGLAKATTGLQLSEQSMFTAFGSVMGTPLYMAPEQASFNAVDVDTRADVYALGVILYELLTGTTPLTKETMKKAALDEMFRLVREQEAPTPSSRLSSADSTPSVAANRQIEPAKLGRFVKGELDWIVMKALSKERERRYETANGFAKDIERFLNHEPVQAGPPSATYRLRKFVRRNRSQVFAASLVFLALVAGVVGTTLGLIRAETARAGEEKQRQKAEESRDEALAERKRADEEAEVAKAVSDFISHSLLGKGNPYVQATDGHAYDKNITLREVVDRAASKIDERFPDRPLVAAALHNAVASVYQGQLEPAKAIPHAERCWELTRSVRGDDHRETIRAVNSIGANLMNNGEIERAQERFQDAYDRARRLFGEEDDTSLLLLNNLIAAYSLNGRPREAAALRRRHNELALRVYGESDVRSIDALLAKASRLSSAQKLDESQDVIRRAYELVRDKLPAHDRRRVSVTERWIGVLIPRGQRAEAEALAVATHESCLKQFKTLGTGSTPWSGRCLARTYRQLGNFEAAEKLGVELLAIERTHSNGNPGDHDLCDARDFLAGVYIALSKPELAEPLLKEQVAHDKSRGSGSSMRLAGVYAMQRKFAEADAIYRDHAETTKKTQGAESAPYGSALLSLGQFLMKQEKWVEAESTLRDGLIILEKTRPGSFGVLIAKSTLGRALLGQKKYAEAESHLLAAFEEFKVMDSKNIPVAYKVQIELIDRIIELYTATNKPDELKKYQQLRANYPTPKEVAPMPKEKK